MTDEKVFMTMNRRNFFKTLAVLAVAAAVSPKVLGLLGEVDPDDDKITYADFVNAVAYLEDASYSGPYYMILPPWLYRDLMVSWDEFLRGEFEKQIPMGEDVMALREISPNRAEYVNIRTGNVLSVLVTYSHAIPEDEIRIVWTTIAEDATLTIGIEEADEVFDYEVDCAYVESQGR